MKLTTVGNAQLGKLVRLLASDREGEVLAAVEALKRTLASSGHDLNDLADMIDSKQAITGAEWRLPLQWLREHINLLAPREAAFVLNMTVLVGRGGMPSARQAEWLLGLFDRESKEAA
jgi:hypothetical protein